MRTATCKGWARVVLGEIADAIPDANPAGDSFPGVDYIAAFLGIGHAATSRAIRAAEKAGDLIAFRRPGRRTHYTLSEKAVSEANRYRNDTSIGAIREPYQSDTATRIGEIRHPYRSDTRTEKEQERNIERTVAATATPTEAIPFSDPEPFTAAARKAGIGAQRSPRSQKARDASKERYALGELDNNAAVKAHRDVCGLTSISREDAERIAAQVRDADLPAWRESLIGWMASTTADGKPYSPRNVTGQLERFETDRKRIEARAKQPQKPTPTAPTGRTFALPQAQDKTDAERAAAQERIRAIRQRRQVFIAEGMPFHEAALRAEQELRIGAK